MAAKRVFPPQIKTEEPRDPDALPSSTDPSGPCTRCGRNSNFTLVGTAPVTYQTDGAHALGQGGERSRLWDEQVAIMECNGYRDCMVVIEEQLVGGVRGGGAGTVTYRGVLWWPTSGASTFGPDVPQSVADEYAEAARCLSASAPNAAVTMLRTALVHIVEDRGSDAAKAKPDLK